MTHPQMCVDVALKSDHHVSFSSWSLYNTLWMNARSCRGSRGNLA